MNSRDEYFAVILEAGSRVFQAKRYGVATVDDVAREAGIAKRTLYRYVDSKEDLLVAIYEQILSRRIVPDGDLAAASPKRAFVYLCEQYLDIVLDRPHEMRLLIEELPSLPQSYRATVRSRTYEHQQLFRSVIERGKRDGSFAFVDDVDRVVRAVAGGLTLAYQWYEVGESPEPSTLGALMAELYLHGLVAAAKAAETGVNGTRGRVIHRTSSQAGPTPDATLSSSLVEISRNVALNRILDASAPLFASQGFANTSSRQIAEAAGMTKSSLYYYVKSKEEILYLVGVKATMQGLDMQQSALELADDPMVSFLSAINQHCVLIDRNLEAVRLFYSEFRSLQPEHRAVLIRLRDAYLQLFSEHVRRLRDPDRTATNDVDDLLAAMILSTLNSTQLWYSRDGRWDANTIARTLSVILVEGIANQAGHDENEFPFSTIEQLERAGVEERAWK